MDFNAVTPGLVIAIYVVVEFIKHVWLKENTQRAMLPLVCVAVGAVLGVLLHRYYPVGIDVDNYVDAVASGGMSGIAATGCNQLWIQFKKYSQGMSPVATTETASSICGPEITNTDLAEEEQNDSSSQAVG